MLFEGRRMFIAPAMMHYAVINIFMLMHFIYVRFFCLLMSPLHNTYCSFCLVFLFIFRFFWTHSTHFAHSEFPITKFRFIIFLSLYSRSRWDYFCFDKYLLNNLDYYVNYCLCMVWYSGTLILFRGKKTIGNREKWVVDVLVIWSKSVRIDFQKRLINFWHLNSIRHQIGFFFTLNYVRVCVFSLCLHLSVWASVDLCTLWVIALNLRISFGSFENSKKNVCR